MSRYIDADEVLEQIRKKLGIKSLDYLLEAERQIVDTIQSAPSIDIVRCCECYHFDNDSCYCVLFCGFMDDLGFCYVGDRKTKKTKPQK